MQGQFKELQELTIKFSSTIKLMTLKNPSNIIVDLTLNHKPDHNATLSTSETSGRGTNIKSTKYRMTKIFQNLT